MDTNGCTLWLFVMLQMYICMHASVLYAGVRGESQRYVIGLKNCASFEIWDLDD